MTAAQIRQQFLDFFRSKGHTIVPSAPVVIKNDPTLLFTNAGMNQFKDFFLGNRKPEHTRIADTQKCLRVSGKHNDLEEVGVDTYHHTLFEMLGNWSFGDYFKKEAIAWSWELLTEIYKIDKDRLYVTVFEGDEKEGLPFDQEAFDEWKKWVPEGRILKGNKKDNFWEMGDTGPCGPCSEIHVDCRSDAERQSVEGKTLVNADHPQVIEIWNNVFMEFNRQKDGALLSLPAKHVDTGMGLERLVRVLQHKTSNYDTDIFSDTIKRTGQLTGNTYTFGDDKKDIAFRVLADHIRAIAFSVADGQLPSNTGAGYVIRRILRRAVRYYYSWLHYKKPLLFQLALPLAEQFKHVFPELHAQQEFVQRVIREEEESFLRTLEKGIRRFEEYHQNALEHYSDASEISEGIVGVTTQDIISHLDHQRKAHIVIDGSFAFELYDTYGFPLDLTALMAQEVGAAVDQAGFEAEMEKQKTRSRAATAIDADDWVTVHDSEQALFTGYEHYTGHTRVLRYRKMKAKGKEQFQIALEETPFYAESGGQVGDTGVLIFGNQVIDVVDTKKENNITIHFTGQVPDAIEQEVIAKVDVERRLKITANHSATHLMHAALRQVLGTHVAQKGSLVSPDLLRFDFSHFHKMSDDEIRQVEDIVNEKIRENIPVVIKEMDKDAAIAMGAMALFGEKYGNTVRVVIIDPDYSVELCGGTHVSGTGNIGTFTITTETAVAAGVRRIEALTGGKALDYLLEKRMQVQQINTMLKSKDAFRAVERLMTDKAALEKRIERLEARRLVGIRNELLQKDELLTVNTAKGQEYAISFVGDILEVSNADALKKLCFELKSHLRDHMAVLGANIDGKAFVAVGMSDTVSAALDLDASRLIKQVIAPFIKGGGGGQKTLATAGGSEPGGLQGAIDAVRKMLQTGNLLN